MTVMPRAYCLVTGCGNRAAIGSRKCEAHRGPVRAPDLRTPKPAYTSAEWRTLSRRIRQDRPWCERCLATADLTVDHIVALRDGGTNDRANLRVLCRSCHGKRSNDQRSGGRPWIGIDGVAVSLGRASAYAKPATTGAGEGETTPSGRDGLHPHATPRVNARQSQV